MGYLSCRADSSVATCRSITAISPLPISRRSSAATSRPTAAPEIERFAYDELEAATSHFADAALLGRGSHGAVYKAVLPSGRLVAVKRPSPRRAEVDNEIRILSSLRGPRLVNLLGYSDPGPDRRPRLLVVEYMPNGTLYDLLHPSSSSSTRRPPGWPRRLRLALQTARALRALHDAEPPVIHRDVKSANVLLDANLDAHLGDFGLALRLPPKGTANAAALTTPAPAGTLGYLDPAYVTPDSLSTKTDVFSFGILLLEIMSGRKAIDVQYSPPSVVDWAVPLLRKGKVVSLFDPRVAPPRDPATRRDLAVLAASCVRSNRERRPSMSDIVERLVVLTKAVSAKVWNGMAVVVGNPCAIVDVQKTVSKRAAAAASEKESTSGVAFDDDDKEADAALEELVPLVGARKPPRPLKSGKVFSEAGDGERRNLLELMARIDGVAGQRFGIGRAKTVRGTSDLLIEKDAVLILRRNQTVKVVESEALGKAPNIIKLKMAKEQDKSGKIQDKADEVQQKAEKIQEKVGEFDKANSIQENTGQIVDKAEKSQVTQEKIQENVCKIQEHSKVVQRNAGKIQDKAEKFQEKEDKIQEKIGKVDNKAENIQQKMEQIIDKAEKSQATPEKMEEKSKSMQR